MKPQAALKLIPLKPDQHPVTQAPKFTTELPFFYLTKDKKLLSQVIVYEDRDEEGRPIRWKVTPNIHPTVGAPGIEAHEVWGRLIKPAIDSHRKPDGQLPAIIRLGKVRECLRTIGWRAGGWEARDFFRTLNQTTGALCEADFWLPTTTKDQSGAWTFRHIKGIFSRITVYAIGSKHLTDEELQQGNLNFDFELEDTVYIQLHPLEVEIQRNQLQQPHDNEYMYSVNPGARRSYELLGPKVFGVVKNSSGFCEFRYSWYVKRHPTLKRYYERFRVTEQIKRVLSDHIASGYLTKFEVRPIKEPNQELDFIVRIYPGAGAKESINRIQTYKLGKKAKAQIALVPTPAPRAPAEQGSVAKPELPTRSEKELHLIRQLNEQFGVTVLKADELVQKSPEETERQIEAYAHRKPADNPAGFIIRAIEENFAPPQSYEETKEKDAARTAFETRQAAIAACQFCRDTNGYRITEKGARPCTHKSEVEAAIETL